MTLWVGCGGAGSPTPTRAACEKGDGSFEPASTVCRAAAGPCDVEERCTGDAPDCPVDALAAAGTVCRPGDLATCDPAVSCTGASPDCPPDVTAHGTPPACCAPLAPGVRDGGFEGVAHGWPDWTEQASTNHATPICDVVVCGHLLDAFPPHAGNGWVVFGGGGLAGPETARVGQVVDLPAAATGPLRLAFWFKAAACGLSTDFLRVEVDGTPLYGTTVADEGAFCADAARGYEERTVDLSALAGGAHAVRFHSELGATSTTGLLVDDVSLQVCLQ
jgi:hypothetical protein